MNFKDNIIKNINFYFDNLLHDDISELADIIISYASKNIIILGIGKSFNIGLQFCDLLRCINFKSLTIEPSKILHGDLGFFKEEDLVITISNSGNTKELIDILTNIKNKKKSKIILLSSKKNGLLSSITYKNFIIPVESELKSCFGLIPTTSFTNFSIFFNQVISLIINKLNFKEKIYETNHYYGDISIKFKNISDFLIKKENCSILKEDDTIKDLIILQNIKKISCSLISKDKNIVGIITDKDLRLYLEKNNDFNKQLKFITNYNFFYLREDIKIKDLKSKIIEFNKQISYNYIPLIIENNFKGLFHYNIL